MTESSMTRAEIGEANLADWRPILHALHARFRTRDFVTGLRLVNQIGEAAERADHHPDLDLRYAHLNVRLYSHDVFGITARDISLAREVSAFAADLGVAAEPSSLSVLELALDTPDYERIKPFWRAVLGYRDNPASDDEVRNDEGDLPPIWFQRSGADEPRQRFHLDIRVPPEVAKQRIEAAVDAGGEVLDETPTFTVLADADGNKVCVCI